MIYPDINEFLHALRTQALRAMPPGAEVFLSAGCSGLWYFNWIRDNYPGIKQHLGVEAYSPKPDSLPDEAVWLTDHIYDMKSVSSNSADIVFAGQTVEHLWPNQMVGFLCEAHRVLNSDGWLILDSPNRIVTQGLGWQHNEHTMEFTVDEIVHLVQLAGFSQSRVKGVWQCYDRNSHTFLPFEPDLKIMDIGTNTRVISAVPHPEDSFIWWLEAQKDPARSPDRAKLSLAVDAIYHRELNRTLQRVRTYSGVIEGYGDSQTISMPQGKAGFVRFGPYMPLQPGRYTVRFQIATAPFQAHLGLRHYAAPAATIDVVTQAGNTVLAKRLLRGFDLFASQAGFRTFELHLTLDQATFGVEFRVSSTGQLPITVRSAIELVAN